MNSWPGGHRNALSQNVHDAWNARHYPGTRQVCSLCDDSTGRCEEDTLEHGEGPLCEACYKQQQEAL